MLSDHKSTWTFALSAPPADCTSAFGRAFSKYKPLAHAKWDVQRRGSGATATYLGRAGIHGIAAGSHGASGAEEAAALGSIVSFDIVSSDNETTVCRMWLSKHGTRFLFFIADAKFIRAYMRAVSGELRKLDAGVRVSKG